MRLSESAGLRPEGLKMKPALYAMTYAGTDDIGGGAIFIGNGKVSGIDAGNVRYRGTYAESGGRLKLSAVLSTPTGATLVTGDQIPAGTKLQLTADWPADFKDGQHLEITVAGKPVTVSFEKIDDI
jgi:hypothetical protein